jgi:hypothetical protein
VPSRSPDVHTFGDIEVRLDALEELIASQLPGLVAPYSPALIGSAAVLSANQAYGSRVVVPRTGTLVDLAIYVGATSGNIDVGVYSTGATRAKLYSTGSIACPAANAWSIVGALSLPVTAGDQLDFLLASDNGVASFGRCVQLPNAAAGQLPDAFSKAPGGALPKIAVGMGGMFPLPATIAEGSVAAGIHALCIIARVA